ncbi:hypothetical protein ACLOJK_012676 [Asimina triloba]
MVTKQRTKKSLKKFRLWGLCEIAGPSNKVSRVLIRLQNELEDNRERVRSRGGKLSMARLQGSDDAPKSKRTECGDFDPGQSWSKKDPLGSSSSDGMEALEIGNMER